jgi:hypothetical protein
VAALCGGGAGRGVTLSAKSTLARFWEMGTRVLVRKRVHCCLLIVQSVLFGCSQARETPIRSNSRNVGKRLVAPDSGLSLQLFARDDSSSAADSIFVGYSIRNGGSPIRLMLSPDAFELVVINPAEKVWASSDMTSLTEFGEQVIVTLPRSGFVGRYFEIECGTPGFTELDECGDERHRISPGVYKMVLKFTQIEKPDSIGSGIALESDTLRLKVYRPIER